MIDKDKWIEEILERELEMFVSVPSRNPAPCQSDPRGFRVHRSAQFAAWSVEALDSYLEDLKAAKAQDKNLMTLKYARMEGLILELHSAPRFREMIQMIVSIQLKWQKELASRFPLLVGRGRTLEEPEDGRGGTSFAAYLRGELETYSEKTLELLHGDMTAADDRGENLTETIYLHMVKNLGYRSIEEAETRIREGRA
jgi:hypothetical protein